MADILELVFTQIPDCSTCQEPSKRIAGRAIDMEGPGLVSILYTCDNKKCKQKKQATELYYMRKEGLI